MLGASLPLQLSCYLDNLVCWVHDAVMHGDWKRKWENPLAARFYIEFYRFLLSSNLSCCSQVKSAVRWLFTKLQRKASLLWTPFVNPVNPQGRKYPGLPWEADSQPPPPELPNSLNDISKLCNCHKSPKSRSIGPFPDDANLKWKVWTRSQQSLSLAQKFRNIWAWNVIYPRTVKHTNFLALPRSVLEILPILTLEFSTLKFSAPYEIPYKGCVCSVPDCSFPW